MRRTRIRHGEPPRKPLNIAEWTLGSNSNRAVFYFWVKEFQVFRASPIAVHRHSSRRCGSRLSFSPRPSTFKPAAPRRVPIRPKRSFACHQSSRSPPQPRPLGSPIWPLLAHTQNAILLASARVSRSRIHGRDLLQDAARSCFDAAAATAIVPSTSGPCVPKHCQRSPSQPSCPRAIIGLQVVFIPAALSTPPLPECRAPLQIATLQA
jgi:hypothetical protein